MQVQIDKPYIDIINDIIAFGFAKDQNEVVRQSILAYRNQLEIEEMYLVNKAVETEMLKLNDDDVKLFNAEDVFSEAGV